MPHPTSLQKPVLELRNERVGFDSAAYNQRIQQVRRDVQSLQDKAVINRERSNHSIR